MASTLFLALLLSTVVYIEADSEYKLIMSYYYEDALIC